jgi:tRNA(Ile)-lysidine synthase
MGASPTPRSAERAAHIAVACSGGRDSTALLHCVARAAKGSGVTVHALHVHHGLMPDAQRWVQHLTAQVGRWRRSGLPVCLHVHHVPDKPAPGDSVEAWARERRYAALADMAKAAGARTVLLAHHRQDQAETVLLQLLRGGGAAGLAAMPFCAQRQGITWMRPWLTQARRAIDAYVARYRLSWVDDQSNQDKRYARSRLRSAVWPALQRAFPDAEQSLAAAAARAQEASAALAELAALDMPGCVVDGALLVEPWRALSPARRALLLRTWLRAQERGPVPHTLVQRLLAELTHAKDGRWPWQGGVLCLYRGVLRWHAQREPTLAANVKVVLDLRRPGVHEVPGWSGRIVVRPCMGAGLAAAQLAHVECRPRSGGESFQMHPGSTARSLKKQYQAAGLPAWQREGPLLYIDAALAYVPGLGLDARLAKAPPGQGLTLDWEPAGGRSARSDP